MTIEWSICSLILSENIIHLSFHYMHGIIIWKSWFLQKERMDWTWILSNYFCKIFGQIKTLSKILKMPLKKTLKRWIILLCQYWVKFVRRYMTKQEAPSNTIANSSLLSATKLNTLNRTLSLSLLSLPHMDLEDVTFTYVLTSMKVRGWRCSQKYIGFFVWESINSTIKIWRRSSNTLLSSFRGISVC